jgi:hydroxypyruvate reductase
MMDRRDLLEAMFRAGVAACHPARALPQHLPEPPPGRTILLAVGKAAATMAKAVEEAWPGPLSGVAVAPHGTDDPLQRIALLSAAHPGPDLASVAAAERLLALAAEAGPDDLVLVLLSGGASALACLPSQGVNLEVKRQLTSALLRSGAPIGDINCVRRHLSAIKGGRLGAASQPARLVTLATSDVVGDRPEDIGSGPTVADASTVADAQAILAAHGLHAGPWSESVKPAEAEGWRADYRVVARSRDALEAAAALAMGRGYAPVLSEIAGEARDVARAHAALALAALRDGRRSALISGGELTVTVRGPGSGGPNREYALALAIALEGAEGIAALAADSDGIDGSADAAGAFVDPGTLRRARAAGLDPAAALDANGSGPLFAALGDALVTGPTGTNVNDIRIILIDP